MSGNRTMPEFDAGDFDALVAGGLVVEERGDADDISELHRLSRRISGQYVDVLASYAGAAFHGRANEALRMQVEGALSGLTRLAEASDDQGLLTSLRTLDQLLPETTALGGTRRRDFMRELSEWVLDFSKLLEPEDAERLRGLVTYKSERLPLLDRLADVRGIGPKRLQRLYCAGLFTVETVAEASAADVASVTGLPSVLAERVVEAARDFAEEERRNVANELRRRSAQLKQTLAHLESDEEERRRVIRAAIDAMNEIRDALSAFSADPEER